MSDIDLDAIEWGPRIPWSGGECPVMVWWRDGIPFRRVLRYADEPKQ